MPDLVITGVKENIARFENVIMKQSYSEAGADSFTTAQVIDEETGNVICECEAGGGGGESDFTTATVTIVDNVGEGLSIGLPIVYEAGEAGEGAPALLSADSLTLESGAYKIALYKGKTMTAISVDVTTSGSIENMPDTTVYIISGDCTITVPQPEG